MAVGADDIALGVLAAADVGARQCLAMAAQAGVENFFGRQLGERDRNGGFAAARGYVSLTRPVAALAAGVFRFFFPRRNAFVMRIAEKRRIDVGMAGAADVTAD